MNIDCVKVLVLCSHLKDVKIMVEYKRKCREIRKSPSMMWKRSIVQATAGSAYSAAALALGLVLSCVCGAAGGAELVIEIPGSGAGAAGRYRLDYVPPEGRPAPNYTVAAHASTINFQGLPGTKYHFMLYYSNDTFADLLTWNQTIITAPEPPTNLTVTPGRNKQATISWSPPALGEYTGFRFKVLPLERAEAARNLSVDGSADWSLALRDLSPGATYQLHAFTLLHDKESAAYASRNFTTKPNTPGKFIVWFRNETTLLVLWQPPYPPGAYTHYKVSIEPADARESVLYVEKEGEPPGPAQAAFKGLVPGRAYNISVQTVSEPEISAPTTAQYRTVPLRPRNVTVPPAQLRETAFTVTWLPPNEDSEFEKYQVSVSAAGGGGGGAGGGGRRPAPVVRARDEAPALTFDGLEPGAHYSVTVKTMSGKVTSWPAAVDLTLRPLPVVGLRATLGGGGSLQLRWAAAEGSVQDQYRVSYHEGGPSRDDSSSLDVAAPEAALDALLPGRNYSVAVSAVSRGVPSNESAVWAATRPLAPLVVRVDGRERGLRLEWRSDVTSRQDAYELRHRRRGEPAFRALTTHESSAELADLFPGAVYELQVAARAHGLLSEPAALLKPVRPLPARSLQVRRVTSNSVAAQWEGPAPGRSALGRYTLRYRPLHAPLWTTLEPIPPDVTHAEITNMTHGELYEIELDTGSEPAGDDVVSSGHPQRAEHTVRPNPVSNVAQLADTRNVTLEWPRAGGRVERYALRWAPERGCGADGARDLPAPPPPAPAAPAPAPAPAPVRAVLDHLRPGCGYTISVAAVSYNHTSDTFTMDTRTRPVIQSDMNIVIESGAGDDEDTSAPPYLTVTYTKTPEQASKFDLYRFRLEGDGEQPRAEERAADDGEQRVRFAGLMPGRLYNITMWTVSHNVSSHPVQRQARLYPRPITQLNATEIGAREVTLTWDRPAGVYSDFEVQYLAGENQLRTLNTSALRLVVGGLQPHTLYTFTVVVRAGAPGSLLTVGRARSVACGTREAPPAAPRALRLLDAAPRRLRLAWDLPPRDAHGVLLRFRLTYAPQHAPAAAASVDFPPDAREGGVEGLTPGATYEFSLRAETGAGWGPAAGLTQHMDIAAPPPPAPHALPAEVRRSTSTVAVRFRGDYFSAANGNVTAYTLLLGEEPRNDTAEHPPSWRDVHHLPLWPPYQVTEAYFPFHAAPVEEFTIGSDRCEGGGRGYCNGPLKAGTRYFVKLRAFTAPDKFTDTAYTIVYTEVDNSGWVAGACAAGALVALGAGALVWARRARRARAAPPAPPAPRPERPVRVQDFIDHYRLMSADSDFRFSEEFEELKHVGREQPTSAADLPVNRPKNRFTNILPYDHSRYKLQPVDDEEGSDYINANYVPGHNSPREFIVTQGPLHSTRDDFWRMCWESGSRAIVMLTRCVEKGREKCDRYWPYDTRPVYYGDIAVTALNESRYPDWTITELMLCRGAEQRVLKHFHFTTWPDFGVPDPPTTLARFVRTFRERSGWDARPVVVHCSAGVGRSGTFITLDTALQQLAARAERLDVFGMVHALRRERVWMVQTEQQYICVHQCLVAVLEGRDLAHAHNHHHLNPAFEDDEGIAESGM